MHNILLNTTNEGHTYESFSPKFLEICNSHKQTDRALAFAFILYDFTNPNIAEVLQNRNYWLALNDISGDYLTVFSFHYKERVEKPGWGNYREKNLTDIQEMMTTTIIFDEPSKVNKNLIETYFGSDIDIKYPSVAFFQVHENKVIDNVLIQLDSDKIEDSFLELKLYIQTAVETLRKITEENKNNSKEIFGLVESNVKSARKLLVIKRKAQTFLSVTELVGKIVGLGG